MIWISLALAGPIRTPAPSELNHPPRRIAIVIGINDYQDEHLPDLKFATKDAGDIAAILGQDQFGDFDQITLLQGNVSRETILTAINGVESMLQRDDLFLLYYAGHGTMAFNNGESELFLMPSDAHLDAPQQTGLSEVELAKKLKQLPARRRVLIVDACYSGEGRSALAPNVQQTITQLRGIAIPTMLLDVGKMDAYLFAARPTDPAVESEHLGNGVYTHFLIEALQGEADGNEDGLVDIFEAHEWARERTMRYTSGIQVPWIRVEEEGISPIYLSGNESNRVHARRALLTGLASLPANAVLHVDGQTRGGGSLEPGWHDIEILVDGSPLLADRVHVSPGSRLSLESLLQQRSGKWGIDIGAAGAPLSLGEAWTAPLAPSIGLTFWPADQGGGRLSMGLRLSPTYGTISDLDPLPTLQGMALGNWTWGDHLSGGLQIGAGFLSRFTPLGVQATPMGSAAGIFHYTAAPWYSGLAIGAETPILPIDNTFSWRPILSFQLGILL